MRIQLLIFYDLFFTGALLLTLAVDGHNVCIDFDYSLLCSIGALEVGLAFSLRNQC